MRGATRRRSRLIHGAYARQTPWLVPRRNHLGAASRGGAGERCASTVRSLRQDRGTVRRLFLFVLLVSLLILETGSVAEGAASTRLVSPRWSAHWLQANPGQPLVLILDPRGATVCFVGLRGPVGGHAVGWRFQPGGHRLSLTLLTHADAAAGSWVLWGLCQRPGTKGHTATVTISVPAPGGSNVLVTHGDMRVQLLSGATS